MSPVDVTIRMKIRIEDPSLWLKWHTFGNRADIRDEVTNYVGVLVADDIAFEDGAEITWTEAALLRPATRYKWAINRTRRRWVNFLKRNVRRLFGG